MAKRYKFEKAYTHIVRDPKSGLVTGHVDYPAGHEGLIKEEHFEGAHAAGAGSVIEGSENASEQAGGESEAQNQVRAAGSSHK
jgi:hypothetical protein